MKELKIEIPEGYEIDKENSSLERIVFKKKAEVNCWEDLKYVTGTYISDNSYMNLAKGGLTQFNNKNVFLNKKYAKSALALAQISQLLPYYDTDIDWESTNDKFCIDRINNRIEIKRWFSIYHVLTFNSLSEAERFLKHNEQLVKDFYML
jgi:hypothetical protein